MDFDEIKKYWEVRAADDDSVQSTTQDVYLREIELNALSHIVKRLLPNDVLDIGCGDGRTTIGLARQLSNLNFFGADYADSMVENAKKVLLSENLVNIDFFQWDICNPLEGSFDLIYTTRCLINLPSWEMQKRAIENIHASLNESGTYIMIENFMEGQDNFNHIRKEYGLPEIPVRDHNNYFVRDELLKFTGELFDVESEVNISSSYYLVSRVIYSKICSERNSTPDYYDEHHRYAAGLPFCGEFGPVRLISFTKK